MGKSYLLLGPERGKKEAEIKKIIQNLNKEMGDEAEIYKFYPFEDSASKMIETALNGSLLSSNIVLIVDQAETIKEGEAKLFKDYFKNPNPQATFIFKSEETAASKITACISKAIDKSETLIFWEMFDSDKRGWLVRFFQEAGLKIQPNAIEYILEMLENNTAEFKATCQQIVNFFPPGTLLTADSLEEFLYHSKEESAFTLFSKIAIGDFQGALDVLKKLTLGGNFAYPQLMGTLLYQLRRLNEWSELLTERYSVDEIANKLQIRSKKGKAEYQKAISLYSEKNIRNMILLTIRTDGQLREAPTDVQNILMELYLYNLIVKKGASAD